MTEEKKSDEHVGPRLDSQGLPIYSAEELKLLKERGFEIEFPGKRPDGERRRF